MTISNKNSNTVTAENANCLIHPHFTISNGKDSFKRKF